MAFVLGAVAGGAGVQKIEATRCSWACKGWLRQTGKGASSWGRQCDSILWNPLLRWAGSTNLEQTRHWFYFLFIFKN